MKIRLLIFFIIFKTTLLTSQSLSDLTFGSTNNLDVVTWNLEWFAKSDQITIDSLVVAINALDIDIVAVQEISNVAEFQTLISQLNGYSGYTSVSNLRLGYIYKSSLIVNSINTIFSNDTYNFAGRPPLVMNFSFNNEDVSIINIHLKCCGDGILDLNDPSDEETRRYNAMNMIKSHIDQNLLNDNVIILGDCNDLITDNISNNVFSQCINDSMNYSFADLQIANGSSSNWSYPSWPSHLDHILITNELNNELSSGLIETIPIDDFLPGGFSTYDAIISDHMPVGISLNFSNIIYGCTDINALNYNSNATTDDGSCYFFLSGCTDSSAVNFDPLANIDDGSCNFNSVPNLIITEIADPENSSSTGRFIEIYNNETIDINLGLGYSLVRWTNGNTNSQTPVMLTGNILSGNFYVVANSSVKFLSTYGLLPSQDIGYLGPADSNGDDNIALLSPDGTIIDIFGIVGEDGTGTLHEFEDGRAERICPATPTSTWNELDWNIDNDSGGGDGPQFAPSDFDPFSWNCNVLVTLGCTDPAADNYDASATNDDGSCTYSSVCNEDAPTGLFVDGIIHSRAVINWDNMNSTICSVDQYRIRFNEVGTSSWTQKTMGGPIGSCTWGNQRIDKLLLGLTANTTYEYEMKAWYCGGGSSAWTGLSTFTTADNCPNVGNLAAYGATPTKATFTWDASNGVYEFVRLKSRVDSISSPTGSDWFQIGGAGVAYGTYTKDKNGLVPGETYRGQARTWCDPNGGAWKSVTWTPLVYWTQPVVRAEGGTAIANLDIYPNPLRDVFNITFTSEYIQDLKVRILNVIGEELMADDLQQFVGEYTKKINLKEYAKGIYFLEIETNDGIINKKLILQ